MSVSGGSVTEATISSLMSSTTYSIEVAAVNSAGTGVYSDLLIVQTESEYNLTHLHVLWIYMHRHVGEITCAVLYIIPYYRCIPQSE